MKCQTCLEVETIYGTSEMVAPWLCECEEKSAAQPSQCRIAPVQQTITLTGSPEAQLANWRNFPNNE
jgi:hypothetical protein